MTNSMPIKRQPSPQMQQDTYEVVYGPNMHSLKSSDPLDLTEASALMDELEADHEVVFRRNLSKIERSEARQAPAPSPEPQVAEPVPTPSGWKGQIIRNTLQVIREAITTQRNRRKAHNTRLYTQMELLADYVGLPEQIDELHDACCRSFSAANLLALHAALCLHFGISEHSHAVQALRRAA